MKVIGYINRTNSYPSEVVIVAEDEKSYYLMYPTQYCAPVSKETFDESVSRFLTPIDTELTVTKGCVGFAFGENDVIVGTPRKVKSIVEDRLPAGTTIDVDSLFQTRLI